MDLTCVMLPMPHHVLSLGSIKKIELSAAEGLKLDKHLQTEHGDDDDDEEEDNDEDEDTDRCGDIVHGDEETRTDLSNPTIQIEFALGTMNDNPIMKLLSTNDSDESSNDSGQESKGGDDGAPFSIRMEKSPSGGAYLGRRRQKTGISV